MHVKEFDIIVTVLVILGEHCKIFEEKYRREQRVIHWKCWVGRTSPLINIQFIFSSERVPQGRVEISPREPWRGQITCTLDVAKKLEINKKNQPYRRNVNRIKPSPLQQCSQWARSGQGQIALPWQLKHQVTSHIAFAGKKGEAQHVTQSNSHADYPPEIEIIPSPCFPTSYRRSLAVTRPLLP